MSASLINVNWRRARTLEGRAIPNSAVGRIKRKVPTYRRTGGAPRYETVWTCDLNSENPHFHLGLDSEAMALECAVRKATDLGWGRLYKITTPAHE